MFQNFVEYAKFWSLTKLAHILKTKHLLVG
jgi:hypothetical protein